MVVSAEMLITILLNQKTLNMKKISLILSWLFISLISTAQFSLTEEQSMAVLLSPELTTMVQLQNQFLDKVDLAIQQGNTLQTIRTTALTALQTSNYHTIYTMLFGSFSNGEAFINSLIAAKRSFLQANPFIEQNLSVFTCQTCPTTIADEANYFFNNFQALNTYRISPGVEEDPIVCGSHWNKLKLIICIGICSGTTGGFGAALCGWGCWCGFCKKSALGGIICDN